MPELELEADRVALHRLLSAGFGLSGIGNFLQRLGQLHGQSVDGADLAVRIEQLRSMDIGTTAQGSASAGAITAPARTAALQRLLNLGQWQVVVDCLAGACADALPASLQQRLLADAAQIRDQPEDVGSIKGPGGKRVDLSLARTRRQWLESDPEVATRWVQIGQSDGSLTLSRDGVAVQSLQLEIVSGRVVPTVAAKYVAASVRSYRKRYPRQFLKLLHHEDTELGAWQGLRFDLDQYDENGLGWRTRVYQLSQSGQQIIAIYRAPARYFFERDLGEIEAMIRAIE